MSRRSKSGQDEYLCQEEYIWPGGVSPVLPLIIGANVVCAHERQAECVRYG